MKQLINVLAKTLRARPKSSLKPFTVIVEGNIGSGKTTLLQHFKKFENVCVMDEPIELWRNCCGHNLLDLMYQNPKEWSFSLQSYVQLTMTQQHLKQVQKPIKLMERSIFSARYCFVEKLQKDNLLPAPSAAVIDEWFKWLVSNTDIHVDLIVYLRTSPEVVYNRIIGRNRKEEKCISFDYIKDLHDIHDQWLYRKTLGHLPAPVLTLNADLDKNNIMEQFNKYKSLMHQTN